MRKLIIAVLLLSAFACSNNNSKLLGEWYSTPFNDGDIINYFTQVTFTNDSLFLRDENLLTYSIKYTADKNHIVFNNKEYTIEYVDDSTIKFLNILFTKNRKCSDELYGQSPLTDVSLRLPEGNLIYKDTMPETDRNKKVYVNSITVAVQENKTPVLFCDGIKMELKQVGTFLEVTDMNIDTRRIINLYMDKDVKMGLVDSIFKEIEKKDIFNVSFVLGNDLNKTQKPTQVISKYIPLNALSCPVKIDGLTLMMYFGAKNNYQQVIELRENKVLFNGKKIDSVNLYSEIKNNILVEPYKTSTVLLYHSTLKWEDFIKQIIAIDNLYFSLRDDRSWALHKKNYLELTDIQQKEIREIIPKKFYFFDFDFYQRLKDIDVPYCNVN